MATMDENRVSSIQALRGKVITRFGSQRLFQHYRYIERLGIPHRMAVIAIAGLALAVLALPVRLSAQSTSAGTVKVPASTGTGIALAAAAEYQVKHNHQWE